MLENNINFLSPGLCKYIPSNEIKIEYFLSKDNNTVPYINNKYLHSKYYPLKEGERFDFKYEKNTIIISVGFGCGYHLAKLDKRFKIIAVSENPEVTIDILKHLDLEKYFDKNQLIICNADELLSIFDFYSFSKYTPIINNNFTSLFETEIKNILTIIKENLNPLIIEKNTQRSFGKKWIKNSLLNLKNINSFYQAPLKISAKAILICGAGPSLETNIEKIKKNKHNIFIASTDTAALILLENNIKPDVIFSYDSSLYTSYHFTKSCSDVRIFKDYTSPLKVDTRKLSILFSNYPLTDFIGISNKSSLFIDTSPGNIGASMIKYFQTNFADFPIITTGIDFGSYNKKLYSKSSMHDFYSISKNDFYNTIHNFNCRNIYKNILTEPISNWQTNSMYRLYRKDSPGDVFTLSTSPFIENIYIDSLDDFLSSIPLHSKSISFNYSRINTTHIKEKLLSLQDYEIEYIFDSYSLFLGKKNCLSEIKELINQIF